MGNASVQNRTAHDLDDLIQISAVKPDKFHGETESRRCLSETNISAALHSLITDSNQHTYTHARE